MNKRVSIAALSAASLAACAGLATPARAINIGPSNVYLWTGQNYGAGVGLVPGALNKPGDPGPTTWTWNQANMASQPDIDSAGRIYFLGSFTASPAIGTISANNNFGVFTATNNTNVALSQSWAAGQLDPTTGLPMETNAGSGSGITSSSYLRVSGTEMGLGVRVGNPTAGTGVFESSTASGLQNNMLLYTGAYNAQSFVARTGDATTILPSNNDWTASATSTGLGNIHTAYQSIGTQFGDMNASGTHLFGGVLDTVGPNPATLAVSSGASAVPGNSSFLGTVSARGAYTVVARGGDLPFGVGGPAFKSGSGNNGVGGFFGKINANGQVAYDAAFFIPTGTGAPPNGGATSANDSTAWIYTPGSGTRAAQNSQFYQEGNNLPVHTDPVSGLQTSNGTATWTGGISTSTRSFSNAGVIWSGTTSGGDSVTTTPSSTPANLVVTNTQVTAISTAGGGLNPTYFLRQNDIAPGYSAASNVHLGGLNIQNMAINNSGQVAFAATLQGAGVTPTVQPVYTVTFPPPFGNPTNGPPTISPGIYGNEAAVFAGTPGITGPTGLHAIARKGDVAPGFGGMTYDISPSSSGAAMMNNAGDVLFAASVANKNVGDLIDQFSSPPNPLKRDQRALRLQRGPGHGEPDALHRSADRDDAGCVQIHPAVRRQQHG